ncbi:hypothetical protein, partial [Shewanella algae]|uniref:hypothetical protein n=1 Tax=Shewanella algae TaxID=38313 RepID=UPI001C90717A
MPVGLSAISSNAIITELHRYPFGAAAGTAAIMALSQKSPINLVLAARKIAAHHLWCALAQAILLHAASTYMYTSIISTLLWVTEVILRTYIRPVYEDL